MKNPAEKLLVADSCKETRFMVKIALRDYRVHLIEASDSRQCLEKARKYKPKLLIINYMMKNISGYSIVSSIRKEQKLKESRIIVMTLEGFDLADSSYGVHGFLEKPFTPSGILKAVKEVLGPNMFIKDNRASAKPYSSEIDTGNREPGKKQKKPEILIADDEEDVIKMLQVALAKNYHLDTASTGEELVQKGMKKRYDLIISDIVMPKSSGWKSIKKLRESGCRAPVIFNSGLVKDRELYETLKPEGPSAFLLKPFKMEKLKTKVKEMLSL